MTMFSATTILAVRRGTHVAIGGDGQVSMGATVVKGNACKVRRLYKDRIVAGFAGSTADAFTLFERFEAKLDQHSGHLTRCAVELAKDWRTDRLLRRLEALLIVADGSETLMISGTGDVISPEHDAAAIGSGDRLRSPRRGHCSIAPISERARLSSADSASRPTSACTRIGNSPSRSSAPPTDGGQYTLQEARTAPMTYMTPREIVHELDKHIVGQSDAKRAVAIALRNRWRRMQLEDEMRAEITPKNILMIGPTGVGKTEIARRLARLAGARSSRSRPPSSPRSATSAAMSNPSFATSPTSR